MTDRRNTQFLKSVREQELLGPAQVTELEQCPLAQSDDLQALGKLILQKGWLTRFQINLIAQARAKDLILGPYRLIDRLGEGGMGQVFKAHHQPMNRSVALKVIRKEKLAHPQAVQRFFREIQAAAKLVHPNIVLAFDAGQVEKTYYFAMEYVDGIDLAKLVKQNGPLPEKVACDYIRQAALGLTHAHEQGMIHRDIKPHNLLVTHVSDTSSSRASVSSASKAGVRDVVKILDMGLARLQTGGPSDHSITQEGAVVGTPDYIAPEQALDARKVDGRSDLYSLGGVFFFLLTGRPPFQGGTLAELLLKHQMEAAPDVRQLRPEISEGVAAIVTHLLAKRPEDRYQTPQDLVQALEPLIQGGSNPLAWSRAAEPNAFSGLGDGSVDSPSSATVAQPRPTARRPAAKGKAAQPLNRKKLLIAAGAFAAVMLLGLVGFLAMPKGPPQKANPLANQPGTPPVIGQAVPPGGFQLLLPPTVTLNAGQTVLLDVRVERQGDPQAIDLSGLKVPLGIQVQAVQVGPNEGRAQVHLVAAVDAPELLDVPLTIEGRAGTRVAQSDVRLTVRRPAAVAVRPPEPVPAAAGKELWKIDAPSLPSSLAVSPDSKFALVGLVARILVIDLATGKEIRTVEQGGQGFIFGVAFLPDTRRFLTTGGGRKMRVLDSETGQLEREVVALDETARGLALTPQSRRFFVWGTPRTVRAHDLDTGKMLFQMEGHTSGVLNGMASADGGRVATFSGKELIWWDAETGKEQGRIAAPRFITAAAISPDGSKGIIAMDDQSAELFDLKTGQEVLRLKGLDSDVSGLAWLPDGQQVLAGCGKGGGNNWTDCTVRLHDVSTGALVKRFEGHQQRVRLVAASPDGRYAISATSDNTVRCWDLKPAPAVAVPPPAEPLPMAQGDMVQLTGHSDKVTCGIISPDGKKALSGSADKTLKLWDLETAKELATLTGHAAEVQLLSWSADGRFALSCSSDGNVRYWDLELRRSLISRDFKRPLTSIALDRKDPKIFHYTTPDGRLGRTLLEANTVTISATPNVFRVVVASPDGRALVGCDDGTLRVWEAGQGNTWTQTRNYAGQAGAIVAIAVNGDGTLGITGSTDSTIRTRAFTGGRITHFQGHQDKVTALAMASDGRLVLSGSDDRTLRLWDSRGLEVRRFPVHPHGITGVALSPDGRFVISACGDKVLRLWDLKAAKP